MGLRINQKAPDFSLPSSAGNTFNLIEHKGSPLIIYFYPKNFTPGCTKEACSFRDSSEELKDLDIKIVGISRDTIQSHKQFIKKHQLPFDLLSDKDGQVCKLYNALIPVLNIPKRITYLLDSELNIVSAYDNLFGYKQHIESAIKALKAK